MQSVPCLCGQAEPMHPVKGGHGGASERPAPGWSSPSNLLTLQPPLQPPLAGAGVLRSSCVCQEVSPPATRNKEHKRTGLSFTLSPSISLV